MTTLKDKFSMVLGIKGTAEQAPMGEFKGEYFETLWANLTFSEIISQESAWADIYMYFLQYVFGNSIGDYLDSLEHAVPRYKQMENEISPEYQAWLYILNISQVELVKIKPKDKDPEHCLTIAYRLWLKMRGRQHQGKANTLIRDCAKAYQKETVNEFFENLSGPSEEEINELRDLAAEGMVKKIGPWKVWKLIRDMLFGKTKKVEPENAKEQRIVIIKAKLEVLFTIPITPENAKLLDEQNKFMNELRTIDPEANAWLKGNAPSSRLGTS